MHVLESDKIMVVDVDDTLVTWSGEKYAPNEKVVTIIKRMYERGQPVIVWSAGGYEWASRIVTELKLEDQVTMVMSKPAWWVDDKPATSILTDDGYINPEDVK